MNTTPYYRRALGTGSTGSGMMGAPVIAGLVFIIYSIGLDAFCKWANDHQSHHPNFSNQ